MFCNMCEHLQWLHGAQSQQGMDLFSQHGTNILLNWDCLFDFFCEWWMRVILQTDADSLAWYMKPRLCLLLWYMLKIHLYHLSSDSKKTMCYQYVFFVFTIKTPYNPPHKFLVLEMNMIISWIIVQEINIKFSLISLSVTLNPVWWIRQHNTANRS